MRLVLVDYEDENTTNQRSIRMPSERSDVRQTLAEEERLIRRATKGANAMVTQADVERVQEEIKPQMMVMIIIHLALMLGAGAYAVFVLVTTLGRDKAADVQPFNTMLALMAVVALCAVMSFVIPSILVATLKRNVTWKDDPANPIPGNPNQQPSPDVAIADTPAKAIMGATMTSRICGLALLEGPMFLCSFLASKYSPWWLVGSATLFLLMAIQFPLSRPLAEWIADEEEQLLESRRNA
jgi:hypothetical protein